MSVIELNSPTKDYGNEQGMHSFGSSLFSVWLDCLDM